MESKPDHDVAGAPDPLPGSAVYGFTDAVAAIRGLLAGRARAVELYGASGSLGAAIATSCAAPDTTLLYVVPDEETAEMRASDLEFFLPAAGASDDPLAPPPVLELAAPDASPYADVQADRRTTLRRMAALFRLSQGFAPRVLVASAAALFRRVVPRGPFDSLCEVIASGSTLDRDATVAALVRAGFSRSPVVEDAGTFAVRGAVIDLYPPIYKHPVRIELFGDEVESIRLYDAATQRTLRPLDAVYVHPVRETIPTAGADPRARVLAAADTAVYPSSKTRRLLEQIEEGEQFFGIEALAPAFHAGMVPLFDYLPETTICVVEEPEAVLDEARRQATRLREVALSRHVEHRLALPAEDFVLVEDEAAAALAARRRLELRAVEVVRVNPPPDAPPRIRVESEPHTTLRADLHQARSAAGGSGKGEVDIGAPLRDRMRRWLDAGHRVRVVAPNRTHAERLVALLRALGLATDLPPPRAGHDVFAQGGAALAVLSGSLRRGFVLPADRLVVVAEEEIFGPRALREARATKAAALGDLGEIAEGDAVVHDEHGIGRYRGLKKLEVRGVPAVFMHLEYDGGSVYVPVYRIGAVHR